MRPSPIKSVIPLQFVWQTADPFLFCVHHDDHYPAGNEQFGPMASLEGRDLGQDFEGKDGWRMYHGLTVPGFPQHPHRGFETVTIVRQGFIDHSDSLGAAARFGEGDVQWLTAGKGIVHSEMFPLLQKNQPNPVELFQIWLNLPAADKMVDPHFSMLWGKDMPRHEAVDERGLTTTVTVVAGALSGTQPQKPPPKSWASRPDTDVAIWVISMPAGARWVVPPAASGSKRWLYFFRGARIDVAGEQVPHHHGIELDATAAVPLSAHDGPCELLLLQGRPIAEPVVQHGPFVMSSRAEIMQAFTDYQRTGFGGWPWRRDDPVHVEQPGRFARHADGRTETP